MTVASRREDIGTLLLQCPICGSDCAEPHGVLGRFDGARDAVVALRCATCAGIYLSPTPSTSASAPLPLPSGLVSPKRIREWSRGLAREARVAVLDGSESSDEADFDLAILARSLEVAREPDATLRSVAARLRPRGRLVVIGANAESLSFAAFGGRHWRGYEAARGRQHFTPRAIERLARDTSLVLLSMTTRSWRGIWLDSLRALLQDWEVPRGLRVLLSGRWVVPLAAGMVVEGVARLMGRGSVLVAVLEKR